MAGGHLGYKFSDLTAHTTPSLESLVAIKTKFVRRVMSGEQVPFKCPYKCLRSCEPNAVPYCIARALCNAANGDLDNAVVFAGSNVVKVNKIVSVKELIDELTRDAIAESGK